MKLADICKDAGALTDLQEERVIRYGTPQLDERLKSEYGDVHLPTIVKRRVGDLNKQREGFQTSLKQIEAQLKTLNEKKEKNQLEWITERERSVAQISTHQKELAHLKSVEQQRTATLDAQIYDLNTQIRKTQQCRNEIITHLGEITNEQLDRQRKILQYQNIASQLTHDLDKAQQMNAVTRFLKRVDPNYLAKQIALVEYQLHTDRRSFNELEERKVEKQNLLAMTEERFEYLKMMLQNTIEQKNTPSADIHEINRIWIVIARYKQYIEHLDIKLKKEQAETEEKEQSLKSQIGKTTLCLCQFLFIDVPEFGIPMSMPIGGDDHGLQA